ncbi:MAG TPA: Crp/Fnr family transcriptional regulator, partial [Rhizomicrobium sp.]
HLEHAQLALDKRLEDHNKRVEQIYFIERGAASVVANAATRRPIEIGVIGREGVTGLAVIMGVEQSPYDTFMQIAGDGWCMRATNLRRRMKDSATLQAALLRYAYGFAIQTAQTAICNGRNKIEERLARRLLMALDRAETDALPLTHELLARMLGVQRPGVTLALRLLEKRGLIRARRRAIRIIDREGLRRISNGAYGVAEAELRRVSA